MASFTWKNPVDGNWNDPSAWDLGVPGGGDTAVIGGGAFTVAITQSNTITDLTVATGVVLAIADNVTFVFNGGTINNAGTIADNSGGNNTVIQIGGSAVTLTGGGTISMDDRTSNWIVPADAADTLVNIDNTIAGSGLIGRGSALNLDNRAGGTIVSTGNAGLNINLFPGTQFLNEGVLEDIGPGGLQVSGNSVDQSGGGTIAALGDGTSVYLPGVQVLGGSLLASGAGAVMRLSDAVVTAPVITASNGGVTEITGISTLDASAAAITLTGLVQIDDNAQLNLAGTIVNTGTIAENSGGNNTSIRVNSAVVTLKAVARFAWTTGRRT